MFIRFLIPFTLSCLSLTLFAQSSKSKPAKQAQPTKAETIQWLNSKMEDKPSSPINDDGTVNRVQESISADGKTYHQDFIIYKTFSDVFAEKPKLYNRNITSVFLADLNPGSLKVRYYKKVFFISVSTTNSQGKIKVMFPSSNPNEPVYEYETRHMTSLDFGPFEANKEENLEQRMIKALKYLITLNGGKAEAF